MDKRFELYQGDCLETLRAMADNSVDSIVTDPPYGLSNHTQDDVMKCLTAWISGKAFTTKKRGFMGNTWDSWVPGPEVWRECFRVLKPGGHILAFAGSRTHDLMSMAMRLAGFECRDTIMYLYGSGFPKSMDVSKVIDKAAGAEREVVGMRSGGMSSLGVMHDDEWVAAGEILQVTAPATEAAQKWQGWGTALKPAFEPVLMFRKPLVGTVAANVLAHGTGSINIDGCRVGTETRTNASKARADRNGFIDGFVGGTESQTHDHGRWPANIITDGSDEVIAGFPVTGASKSSMRGVGLTGSDEKVYGKGDPNYDTLRGHDDAGGSAARFFYCAKASKRDRDEDNNHPTVKPTDLMRYLCRLVTPPNGVVLDPFNGSGSTGKAAMLEGFRYIGCELSEEYIEISRKRIEAALNDPKNPSTKKTVDPIDDDPW